MNNKIKKERKNTELLKKETLGSINENKVNLENKSDENANSSDVIFGNQIVPMWASTEVASSILGITPNALRIRKCRGEIQCRYFGRYLRFNVAELLSQFRDERI